MDRQPYQTLVLQSEVQWLKASGPITIEVFPVGHPDRPNLWPESHGTVLHLEVGDGDLEYGAHENTDEGYHRTSTKITAAGNEWRISSVVSSRDYEGPITHVREKLSPGGPIVGLSSVASAEQSATYDQVFWS